MSDAVVAEGAKCWAKIGKATDFASWRKIAVALAIGRSEAMKAAGVNRPFGKKYATQINL